MQSWPHGKVFDSGAKANFYSNNIKMVRNHDPHNHSKVFDSGTEDNFHFNNMFVIPWHDFGFVMSREGCCVLSQMLGLLPLATNNLQYYKTIGYMNVQVHSYTHRNHRINLK